LSFNFPVDFDENLFDDNVFTVEVTADDGTNNATVQTITVNVEDGDPAPSLSSVPETISVLENDTFSDFISALDDFDNQTVTITLGGPDAAFFVLANPFFGSFSSSARLELVAPLDFETPLDADGDNIYIVDVIASDGVNTTTETVSIIILDQLESANAPVFTTPDTATVGEGTIFVQTVVATDADGETPTYSITGGDDRFDFTIDRDTGELSFRDGAADFDENLLDDNIFTVEVTADDGSTNQTTQTISVTVEDGDPAPSLSSVPRSITVTENDTFSDFISARDDFDNQSVTITLGGPDAAFFVLANQSIGSFSTSARLELVAPLDFETPLDADGDNVYEVNVIASDGVNTTTESVILTVRDEFESANAPVFISPDSLAIDEGETEILTVVVEDADGEIPSLFISGGEDSSFFNLDRSTGELSLRFDLTFSPPGGFSDNFYDVEISADDGSGNITVQTFTLEILDVNLPPEISVQRTPRVEENTVSVPIVLQADDFRDNETVTITLGGEDASAFTLTNGIIGVASTASLQFTNAPDFENPTDADGDNIYTADVDEIGATPVFVSSVNFDVNEFETFVGVLEATDADGDDITFNIISNTAFDLGGTNGNELSFVNPATFNPGATNEFTVTVSATDTNGNITLQNIFLSINDVNVAPNLFVNDGFALENDIFTGVLIFGDDLDFDVLTISLSGVDAAAFSLMGDITDTAPVADIIFNIAPDFEAPLDADGDNIYEVTVELTDGVNIVTQDIKITVEDDSSEVGTIKSAPAEQAIDVDLVLASFEVLDNDEVLDLNTLSETGTTLEDVYSGEFRASTTPDVSFEVDAEQIGFELESSAVDMQFAADLLLLQDSSAPS